MRYTAKKHDTKTSTIWRSGSQRVDVPLLAVVAASNKLPDHEELDALYDRFLFRCPPYATLTIYPH